MAEAEISVVFTTNHGMSDDTAQAFWAAGSDFARIASQTYQWTRHLEVDDSLGLMAQLEQSRQAVLWYVNRADLKVTRWVQLSIQVPTRPVD